MQNACMNKQIHIRDFDGASYGKLSARAKKQGMSLSQYLRIELANLANRPTMEELGEKLRKIRRNNPVKVSSEEIVQYIHEGREERTQQILDAAFPTKRK